MRTFLKTGILLTIIIGLMGVSCQSVTDRKEQSLEMKVQNLETFARLYGYARWFHPSDEAQEIDWDKFAVLGVQKVENVKSTKELRDTLYRLFSPIVQGLQIYETRKPEIFNPEILLSPDPDAKAVAWQHYGVYLNDKSNVYKSIRTNASKIDTTINAIVARYLSDLPELNGKEIKFSGHFKGNKGDIKLFIHPFISSGNTKNQEVFIKPSQEWKKHEITLTIPEGTTSIFYGFEISGDAEVWADDFEFVVEKGKAWEPIDTTNMGFESGKGTDESNPIENWMTYMIPYTVEVSDKDPYSGKYCLKISYPGKMFKQMPQFGEITKAPIGSNLICVIPLTLQTNNSITYPQTETTVLNNLQSELATIHFSRYISDPQENLASVIIAWNVLQHFFPYFDVIDTNWDKILGETLKNTYSNKQKKDFYITLSQMIAQIDDGHGVVFSEDMYHLPIRTEYIENKIIITASNDSTLKRGDIIHKIDGKPVIDVLDEKEKRISGSPQLRRHRALNILGSKLNANESKDTYLFDLTDSTPKNNSNSGKSSLVIERDGKELTLLVSNTSYGNMFFNRVDERPYLSETIVEIEPGIYYINMANCSENKFEQKKDVLAKAKAVIYDKRGGGALSFFQIVPYLIEEPVTSTWWNIPQTIYPDRKEIEFDKSNWDIQPKQPLFKSKSIIINDPAVVSAGETIMGIIDHYNLATTVGEATAGCNGNVNHINLPCGYRVMFTGMKVLKHDGSQLYLKGFEPDYPVNKTIQAIKEGRDEYLEKALEIAKQQ